MTWLMLFIFNFKVQVTSIRLERRSIGLMCVSSSSSFLKELLFFLLRCWVNCYTPPKPIHYRLDRKIKWKNPSAIRLEIFSQDQNSGFEYSNFFDTIGNGSSSSKFFSDLCLVYSFPMAMNVIQSHRFFDIQIGPFSSYLSQYFGFHSGSRNSNGSMELCLANYERKRLVSILTSTGERQVYFSQFYFFNFDLNLSGFFFNRNDFYLHFN